MLPPGGGWGSLVVAETSRIALSASENVSHNARVDTKEATPAEPQQFRHVTVIYQSFQRKFDPSSPLLTSVNWSFEWMNVFQPGIRWLSIADDASIEQR